MAIRSVFYSRYYTDVCLRTLLVFKLPSQRFKSWTNVDHAFHTYTRLVIPIDHEI